MGILFPFLLGIREEEPLPQPHPPEEAGAGLVFCGGSVDGEAGRAEGFVTGLCAGGLQELFCEAAGRTGGRGGRTGAAGGIGGGEGINIPSHMSHLL